MTFLSDFNTFMKKNIPIYMVELMWIIIIYLVSTHHKIKKKL